MIFEFSDTGQQSDSDVCIVGAGPVGLALAFKCAAQGLSVTVLESGGADTDNDQNVLGPVEILTPHHAETSLTTRRGIGGTSILWGGRCVTLDDIDFQPRDFVAFSGWPISHREIAQHYDEALSFLGYGRDDDALRLAAAEASGDIVDDFLERWSAKPDLKDLHEAQLRKSERITVRLGSTVTAIALDASGAKVTGVHVRSRGSDSFIRAKSYVLASGGLENARLLLAAQQLWPDKFGGPDGALGRFYCGHLTGYLAAIRFAKPDFAKRLWYRKNRDGSHIRRRLALSQEAQLKHSLLNGAFWLDSFSVADPEHGSGALSMLYVCMAMLGLYPKVGNGLAPSPTEPKARNYRRHFSNIRQDPRLLTGTFHVLSQLVGRRLGKKIFALANPENHYLLRYHTEQVPDPTSRATLSEREDGAALPRLSVDFHFQKQDVESVVRSHEIIDEWLQSEGIGRLHYLTAPERRDEAVLNQALDGYHQIGLTRMSESQSTGVVDRNCRVHDVANLFVAGSSVFPTAGQANPTLPAVALALRLADHLGNLVKRV
ncbi:GMC oxidoreductase [Mesorhizobium sp. SB112]|uniref:GMC oxidoreductase n=2 Tax=Pseudomonadota TaxID=1224 RepID=UPI00326420F0